MSNERLIEKIKKLFALADNAGATSNEAETAMRMANKLLDKHNLSMGDLKTNDVVFFSYIEFKPNPWIRITCASIARLYDCTVIHSPGRKELTIFGTEANRVTAMIVISDLVHQIERDCVGKGNAFRNGAASSLSATCQRLIRERRNDKEEIMPGTGLVPVDLMDKMKQDVDDFISAAVGETTSKRSTAKTSHAGYEYGKGLNPNARITGNQTAIN